MAINPVVPLPDSRLVVDTQAVIIDFEAAPVEVQVDSIVVWDDAVGFQNGWGGSYIVNTGIWRLVCDPPAAFAVGSSHTVYAETAAENRTYGFYVGLQKLTTEADLSAPQVVKVDTFVWSAHVHDNEDPAGLPPQFDGPGNVYLRILDPLAGEVLTVPGNEVGLVYDEGRNKVVIYFIRNETVFYMEADPADVPTTQSQIRSLEATIHASFGGEGHHTHSESSFPPIKKLMEQPLAASFGGEGHWYEHGSPHGSAPAPDIISGALDGAPVILRITRPTAALESELLIGYHVVKFFRDTPGVIGYVAMAPEDAFVEFIDSNLLPGCGYAVMPVYHHWMQHDSIGRPTVGSPETRIEDWGTKSILSVNSISQLISSAFGGEGHQDYDEASFPPSKLAAVQGLDAVFGGEGYLYWLDSSFDPIGT